MESSSVDHTYALLPNVKRHRTNAKICATYTKKNCTETKCNLGCACFFFLMFLQFFTILYPRFRFTESKNLKKLFVHLDVRFHFLQTEHQTRPGTHTQAHTHFILVQTGRNFSVQNHIHAAQKKLLGNKQSIMINLPATKGGGAMPAIVAMITLSSSSSSSSASPKQPCNVCNGICRCN